MISRPVLDTNRCCTFGMAPASKTCCFSVATVFTARGCKGGLTGAHKESEELMFIIGREDWDLLQAVKDLGLTAEKVREMDEPAPLPMMGNEDAAY